MIGYPEIDKLARNIEGHAFKRGCVSAFTLTAFPAEQDKDLLTHITRECDGLVYGNAEVKTPDAFGACVEALDGRVDYIVYDTGLEIDVTEYTSGSKKPRKSVLLPYCDITVWVESLRYTLLAKVPDIASKAVVAIGLESASDVLLARLSIDLTGFFGRLAVHFRDCSYTDDDMAILMAEYLQADIIIGAAIYQPVISRKVLELCEKTPLIVDAGIGTLEPDAAEFARESGLEMIRVDNRAAMAGMLFSLIQSYDLVSRVMGRGEIDGIEAVAGGVIGAPGTAVVDSVDQPSIVIGFADGMGRIRYEPENDEERDRLNRIRKSIGEIDG